MIRHKSTWTASAAETLLAKHCSRVPTVTRYSLNVITGEVAVGRMVFLAVERFLDDLRRSTCSSPSEGTHRARAGSGRPGPTASATADGSPSVPTGSGVSAASDFPYFFDPGGAVSIIKYFRDLCPFKLEPFQQFIVANLFGWKKAGVQCEVHPNGHRRFQTAYIEIGKGSGKTPLAAGIGTYLTCADGEPGAEIYVAAPSKEQAAICFRDAVRIVDGDDEHPELSKIFKQFGCSGKMLSGNLSVGTSFMRPVSAEHKTLDGPRPHGVIADEVHEHPNTLVLDKLTAGFKARHQPIAFEITNSGWDRETICYYHHNYSRQVLDKVIVNDAWFAYPCQLDVCAECREKGKEQPTCPNCDDWLDPDPTIRKAVWLKANPGLGTILQVEYLEKQVKEALEIPATRNLKLRLNFCIWTQSDERFISPEAWRACAWEQEAVAA